jgi:biotin synthase-related radical SAM superfamily protein
MTSTLRAQLARSRQAQSGAKRIEVVLDARSLACLEKIKAQTGVKTNAEAICRALYAADALLTH